jgi:hypothetical protein
MGKRDGEFYKMSHFVESLVFLGRKWRDWLGGVMMHARIHEIQMQLRRAFWTTGFVRTRFASSVFQGAAMFSRPLQVALLRTASIAARSKWKF